MMAMGKRQLLTRKKIYYKKEKKTINKQKLDFIINRISNRNLLKQLNVKCKIAEYVNGYKELNIVKQENGYNQGDR